MEFVDIVLGCSFGDEGKGKVVYDLLCNKKNKYDMCVRFNGSSNAGHTVYVNEQKYVLHQLPIGVLCPKMYNLISSDALIDIPKLRSEINKLGVNIKGRLFVSQSCHVISKEAIEYDVQNNVVGTTGSGIGYTYSQKMLRTGKRAEDFKEELEQLGVTLVDMRKFWKMKFERTIYRVLLEGAQGFELDINWTNNYPFCTSSTCTLAGAINTGIPIRKIRNIYGITKIYDTYVGAMKFQPDDDDALNKIGDLGKEYGSTTGRRRQCNYLNMDNLIEAISINQCNICIINKVDIVDKLGVYKLYHNGELVAFSNLETMKDYISSQFPFVSIVFSSNPYKI